MGTVMTGDIYIKRGPFVYTVSEKDKQFYEELLDPKHDDDFKNYLKDATGHESSEQVVAGVKDMFRSFVRDIGTKDYYGCKDFWISTINDGIFPKNGNDKCITLEFADVVQGGIASKAFSSMDELNKEFISLRSFLQQGEYVGKNFKRTKPLNGICFYMQNEFSIPECDDILALYRYGDILLVYGRDGFNTIKPEYSLISAEFLEDGNYSFYGKKNKEYYDQEAVYEAVKKQVHTKVKKYTM